MFIEIINFLKDIIFFTGSYSNNIFPEPLNKIEEEKYIELMTTGDHEARNKLIEHNLRLVAHIVKKFDSSKFDSDDLISIGTIGLIKGIDSYSKSKSTRITTYAARCIENEILMHFRSSKKHLNNISLNDYVGYDKDGNEVSLIDLVKDDEIDIATKIHLENNIDLLTNYLKVLNEREKEIITKRYGLFNTESMTQKQISKELKISRSYVSRIEKRALTRLLKEFIKSKNEI